MQTIVIDLNCKDKEYNFNMSVISEKEWNDFAHDIVLAKGEYIKDLELNGYKVVIRDNKAKFKLFYKDSCYHELEYHLDEFGRVSKNYGDVTSALFQDIMIEHYGEDYKKALRTKMSTVIEQTI